MRRLFYFVLLVIGWSALDVLAIVGVREGVLRPWEAAAWETILAILGACWIAGKMEKEAV